MDNNNKIINDLFKSVELIAEKKIEDAALPTILIGNVIESLHNSDAYRVSYLNTEIIASTLGGLYKQGDEVFVLVPNGINSTKFILGKTNNRTPTVAANGEGLSEKDLQMIQDIINQISNLSSDNIISAIEKSSLELQWKNIQKSFEEIEKMRTPYEDEVNIDNLVLSYNKLKTIFEEILANMNEDTEINGPEFRRLVGEYLQYDTQARLDIQEAIRRELTYKVEIISTNGETFKNNIINTTFKVIIIQGKTNITNTIPGKNILWSKLDSLGEPIDGWAQTGREIEIDQNDVEGKQVFRVNIQVEDAIVASDIVTIVDLNDINAIQLSIDSSQNKNQTYNVEDEKYIPDYIKNNQILTASTVYGSENITDKTTFRWFFNDEEILVSDDRFTKENNILTLKKNFMDPEINKVMKIRCQVNYFNTEYGVDIEDFSDIEFSCVKDGSSPILAQIIPTKGTAIKNEGMDLVAELSLTRGVKILVPDSIKWEQSDNGEIWYSIPFSKDLTKITILRETINGMLHVRANVTYNKKEYQTPSITFLDLLDSVNTSIIGSGIFKDNSTNTFSADIYLGQGSVENPEESYDIIWSVTNQAQGFSLFDASWPKSGKKIVVGSSEVPDNNGIALVLNLMKKDSEEKVSSVSIGLQKMKDGKNQYTHIRYSPNEDGSRMTKEPEEDTRYIGILISSKSEPSENPKDYSWTLFVGKDGEDATNLYRTDIYSPKGNIFKNGVIDTTLYAKVYRGELEITDELDANCFVWRRESFDSEGDVAWNDSHAGGVKFIKITKNDVYNQATFLCDIKEDLAEQILEMKGII